MDYAVLRATFDASNAPELRAQVREALIRGSYAGLLHPLGFYYIRLAHSERSSFRLHYWRPNDRGGTAITPYHDHVWHLRSCVLVGELENVLFDVHEDIAGDYTISQIRQVNGVDEVIPGTDRVSMRITSRKRHCRGEFYEVAPRSFHFTDVQLESAVVTVVRSDVVVEGGPRTLMPVGSPGHAPARVPLADSGQVTREIAELLEA